MEKENIPIVDFHEKIIKKFIKKIRPPEDIRDRLDIGYTFENHVLIIFEIRPLWDGTGRKVHMPSAKTRYIKSRKVWRNYWMRASGKWDPYKPLEEVNNLLDFLDAVDEDKYCCFWG